MIQIISSKNGWLLEKTLLKTILDEPFLCKVDDIFSININHTNLENFKYKSSLSK